MSELTLSPADLTKLADLVADRLAAKLAHADELIDCYEAARLLGIACHHSNAERLTARSLASKSDGAGATVVRNC